jgi:hypothetical protein
VLMNALTPCAGLMQAQQAQHDTSDTQGLSKRLA